MAKTIRTKNEGKEVKVRVATNGYILTVIDLDKEGRAPEAQYVAKDLDDVLKILKVVYELSVKKATTK